MALPTRDGTLSAYSPSNSSPGTIDVSSVPDGSWMLLVAAAGNNGNPVLATAPTGWTTLVASFAMNTRRVAIFGKIKDSGDGTVSLTKGGATCAMSIGVVYGSGAEDPSNWQIGTGKFRNDSPSENTTTTAPSITTTINDTLALAISVEATNAEDDDNNYPTTSVGWTNWLYVSDVPAPDTTNIEQIRIGYKEMPTPGATGDAIDTYENTQTLNGWAIQIGVISADPSEDEGGGSELDPITIVGSETAFEAASNSITLDVPDGVQKGDMLVAAIRHQTNVSSVDMTNANFTRVGPDFVPDDDSGRITGFYVHTVTNPNTEPTSYTFTKSEGGATRCVGVMILARPGAGGELNVVAGTEEYTGVAGTDRATNTYDIPDGTDGIEIMLGAAEFTPGNDHALVSTPAGFTEIAQVTTSGDIGAVSRTTIWTGYRTAPDPAGAAAINFVGTPVSPVAQAIVIGQTVAGPPTSYGLKVWDGAAETDAVIWVYDGSTEQPVQDVLALPHQSYTITEMEDDIANGRMVYWTHRGGSANFSEMTMRAYTNAIWHGAKVLEYSARRTADGVWIGMHDSTLDRTTALSGNVSSFNWEDLEGVAVDTPVADGGTISRIEDLISAYPNFILMFDDKANTFQSEFLTLLKTVPDWQEHVIVKFDGEFAASMGAAAKAQGFKTCAYFYDDAVDTHLPAIVDDVDYIGLNYDADPTHWATALSYGKPVWGHVLPNTAAAATAISKGATILQCANVLTIIPKYNDLP